MILADYTPFYKTICAEDLWKSSTMIEATYSELEKALIKLLPQYEGYAIHFRNIFFCEDVHTISVDGYYKKTTQLKKDGRINVK